jgi:hypothetical protein
MAVGSFVMLSFKSQILFSKHSRLRPDTNDGARIPVVGMTYDGYLAAAAPGAAGVLDRDLNIKDYVTFGGEAVDNSICIDDKGGIKKVASFRRWPSNEVSVA